MNLPFILKTKGKFILQNVIIRLLQKERCCHTLLGVKMRLKNDIHRRRYRCLYLENE
jgi:hypothetical protein